MLSNFSRHWSHAVVALCVVRKWATKGRSWWALAHTSAVEKGMSNTWFESLGLVSVEEKWRAFQEASAIGSGRQMALRLS